MALISLLVSTLAVSCVFGADSEDESSSSSSECSVYSSIPTNKTLNYSFEFEGNDRKFKMFLPSSYYDSDGEAQALPVVYGLPGYWTSQEAFSFYFGMQEIAEENGFIAVITTGQEFVKYNFTVRAWNDLACSGSPHLINDSVYVDTCDRASTVESWGYAVEVPSDCTDGGVTINGTYYENACNWCDCDADDIGFLIELQEYIKDNFCIDEDRQYMFSFNLIVSVLSFLLCILCFLLFFVLFRVEKKNETRQIYCRN